MRIWMLCLLLSAQVFAQVRKPIAIAKTLGYGDAEATIVLSKPSPDKIIFDMYEVGIRYKADDQTDMRYVMSRQQALEFKRAYYAAKNRVLTMRPDERCQEAVDLGGLTGSRPAISYYMAYDTGPPGPLKIEISKGWTGDNRRRIKVTSRDYTRFATFTILLTGKGANAVPFERLLNKI
ncbi:MAG: hypothetical protein U0931_14065 [Vulcanimicrobiota bacterium]